MAEFYIEKIKQTNGNHLVHKSDCSALPDDKESIYYLGSISNCGSAIKKASEFFTAVNGCSVCNTEYHTAAAS